MEDKTGGLSFTQGSIPGVLFRFALPILGAMILQAAYGAVDLLVIGMYGSAASISAVGTGSVFMAMVTFVITGLAIGTTVTIGRHVGEKKPRAAGDTVGTTIFLFLILGVILTIVLELGTSALVNIMQVPPEAAAKTTEYLRICFGGISVIIAYNVISSILRGVGNAKLPLLFVGIACVVNIIGDLLLIGPCHMDVAGAAWATVLAQLVAVLAALFVLAKKKLDIIFTKRQLKIFRPELKQILHIGVPIALQEATVQVSFLVINSIINSMGLMPSAGYGVAQKIISFIMLVPSSLMQSLSTYVAQNMGAGKEKRALKGMYTAALGGSLVGIVMFCLGFFEGGLLSQIFTSDLQVMAESAAYLKGFCGDCILTCTLFSCIGYFTGCGMSTPVMMQGIFSALCIRIPVSFYMASLPQTNLTLVGLAAPITSAVGILFFMGCFFLLKKKSSG